MKWKLIKLTRFCRSATSDDFFSLSASICLTWRLSSCSSRLASNLDRSTSRRPALNSWLSWSKAFLDSSNTALRWVFSSWARFKAIRSAWTFLTLALRSSLALDTASFSCFSSAIDRLRSRFSLRERSSFSSCSLSCRVVSMRSRRVESLASSETLSWSRSSSASLSIESRSPQRIEILSFSWPISASCASVVAENWALKFLTSPVSRLMASRSCSWRADASRLARSSETCNCLFSRVDALNCSWSRPWIERLNSHAIGVRHYQILSPHSSWGTINLLLLSTLSVRPLRSHFRIF